MEKKVKKREFFRPCRKLFGTTLTRNKVKLRKHLWSGTYVRKLRTVQAHCIYVMSYLDIDQILYEEERIPCVLQVDAYQMGFLDPSINNTNNNNNNNSNNDNNNIFDDLPENTRIELPLWLVLALNNFVQIELPKHYNKKMRDEILAGADNINLKEFSNYFFEVGTNLAFKLDSDDLKVSLQHAFAGSRYRSLVMHALSSWNDDITEFAQNLTSAENSILCKGKINMYIMI